MGVGSEFGSEGPAMRPHGGIPVGVLQAAGGLRPAVLVGYTVGPEAVWVVVDENGQVAPDGETRAAEILLAALQRPDAAENDAGQITTASPDPAEPGTIQRALSVAARHVRARVARRDPGAVGSLSAHAPGARAARRLMAELGRIPGGPDAAVCARADVALQWLARPHDAGTEAAIAEALRTSAPVDGDSPAEAPDPATGPALLATLERIRGNRSTRPSLSGEPALIGILAVRAVDEKPTPAPGSPAAAEVPNS